MSSCKVKKQHLDFYWKIQVRMCLNDVAICPLVKSLLPKGFVIRALEKNDYEKGICVDWCILLVGFLDCLGELTVVGNLSKGDFIRKIPL